MSSAHPNEVFRFKSLRRSLLLAGFGCLIAGVAAWAQQGPTPEQPKFSPPVEVIDEIVATSESLPVPDPVPTATPEPTPDAPVFAPRQDVEVAPVLTPAPPVRGADVAFPTPAGASTNEPMVMFGRPVAKTDYGSGGNRDASRLRSMPPQSFTFDRSSLRDVLRPPPRNG